MTSRRRFLAGTTAMGAACWLPPAALAAAPPFRLGYAPHAGHFEHSAGPDIAAQIRYAADAGFRAWEDNDMRKRDAAEQERLARTMAEAGVRMGVFVGADIDWDAPTITSGDGASRDRFLADIRESIEVAQRVDAEWMTIVPGHVDPRLQPGFQSANVIETLKRAAALLEPHGLVMVLEPLNFRDHPGMFLTTIPQAYLLCKAVASPACKILFDVYHQQITEGSIIPNVDAAWDEIAYFQVGDVPGRNEPTTGEINYQNVFRHLHAKGYRGVVGMEHGKSQAGEEGEAALIAAYRRCDDFQGRGE